MIQIEKIAKAYGPQTLFKDASFTIGEADRIGVVGPNGAGKSTLFKVLSRDEMPDEGTVRFPKMFTVGLLKQEWIPHSDDSAVQAVVRLHHVWFNAKTILEENRVHDEAYDQAQSTFELLGGFAVEAEAKQILSGLGFTERMFDEKASSLSGGWRMRIQLSGLLLSRPDLLLLDEPTNHLDVESVIWFENFLKDYDRAFMLISHDRKLISTLCHQILEFTPPRLKFWPVSYKKFVEDKQIRMTQVENEIKNREKKIAQLQEFINKFKAKASKARQAQSKLKSAESIQDEILALQAEMPLVAARQSRIEIQSNQRNPKVAVEWTETEIGYTKNAPLFHIPSLVIEGGKKTGIIGANGIGKSTLLKSIVGELVPLQGQIRRNEQLRVGYFAQHRLEDLPMHISAYDYLMEFAQGRSISQVRSIAASLGIFAHDLEKQIRVLSGGEKARVSLAKIILDKPDILLLDEPTNHLDIEAVDSLMAGLRDFPGTLMVVSHDRDFLDAVVTQIVEIKRGEAVLHIGNFSDWAQKELHLNLDASHPSSSKREAAPTLSAKERRRLEAQKRLELSEKMKDSKSRLKTVEQLLSKSQSRLKEIDTFLMSPESPKSPDFTKSLKERSELEGQLQSLEDEYLMLLSVLEQPQ